MTIVILCIHRLSDAVILLVARLCALPADEGMALRGKVSLDIVVLRSIVE